MAENKTKATAKNPSSYIAAINDESRREDCDRLVKVISNVTKQKPVMWGTAIVGFGIHKYPLAGGKEGVICAVGFSSRKSDISIYGLAGDSVDEDLLSKLGKHERGKGCLYVRRLADINLKVLEKLVGQAFKAKNA
jgi:hypothetical protein